MHTTLTVERQDTTEALQEVILVDLAFPATISSHDGAHGFCVQHEPCTHILISVQIESRERFFRSGLYTSSLKI